MDNVKKQSIKNSSIKYSTVIQAENISIDESLLEEIFASKKSKKLLNKLILDNILKCKILIVDKDLIEAQKIIDTIFTYGLTAVDKSNCNQVYFLKAIIYIVNNQMESVQSCIENIDDKSIYDNINFILSLNSESHKTFDLSEEFRRDDFLLFLVLDILFAKGEYKKIVNDFQTNESSNDIAFYYWGLSSINLGNYEDAVKSFDIAKSKKNKIKYQFHHLIAKLDLYVDRFSRLEDCLPDLDKTSKKLNQLYFENQTELARFELAYTVTYLNALLTIHIDEFISSYNSLGESLKNEYAIRVLFAQYNELIENFVDALEIYKTLIVKLKNEEIYFKILYCNMILKQYDEIISEFLQIDKIYKSPRIVGIYLTAINVQRPSDYNSQFDIYFKNAGTDIDTLLHLTISTNNNLTAKHKIYDVIKPIDFSVFIDNACKLIFAHLSFDVDDISLFKKILFSLHEPNEKDLEHVYFLLSQIRNHELREEIADWFIEHNIKTSIILGVKVDSLMEKERYKEALILLKELFYIKPTEKTAMNIVQLTNNKDSMSFDDYNPFLKYLDGNNYPLILMICAMAYSKLGQLGTSESLSYKAIYLLNNNDDYQIYDYYLSLFMQQIHLIKHHQAENDRIVVDSVVTLKCLDNNEIFGYCFNQESEYQKDTVSFGIQHISKDNILFLKLLNKSKGDVIDYQNKKYEILDIIDKHVHVFRYVLQKVSNSATHKSPVILKTFFADDSKDFKQQLLDTIQPDDSYKNLLDLYHFNNNSFGIPIESINKYSYDDYADVVKFLLFGKEQAIYAGLNHEKISKESKVVISLSALVVLNCINKLELLDNLNEIIIPKSLLSFIQARSENASKSISNSPGKLFVADGELVMIPIDKTLPDFWNKIYETLCKLSTFSISDEERVSTKFGGVALEDIFSKVPLHNCQLDCLILAKNEGAIYLSDDLFLRRLSRAVGVSTMNSSALFDLLSGKTLENEIIALAETNYIYLPFIKASEKTVTKLVSLLMNSELKTKLYLQRFKGENIIN